MCGRVRLFSDVSEIKLVFSILPHRPVAAERNIEALAVPGEEKVKAPLRKHIELGPTETLLFFSAILLRPACLCRPHRQPSGAHPRESPRFSTRSGWSL
jgi:hypothetical protein